MLAIESPYDELFADITAAVYFNDPEVIAVAIGILSNQPPVACRSFTAKPDPTFNTLEAHCELSSARAELWKHWIRPRLSDKKFLLRSLAKLLVGEINWRIQTQADSTAAVAHLIQTASSDQ